MEMENYKMVLVHVNESQKGRLEDFFEDIDFYYYTVQSRTERVISKSLRHKNNKIWPGTDCFFTLVIAEEKLEEMLSYLKTFRMSLPEGIIMSVGIIPVERIIPSLYQEEIPVKEELLEALKKKHNYK
ncbi:PG0541 family transporter-associated protein [Fusobacterium necrophorum]|nr:PG0541 family transporter-associated protein [Fusobacterium necrophorum]EHO19226.1 hypothetical protein HMPREF9466_01157 [Fusobacterium necrophorum subsp. funduliforme 1_1_36S]AVQ21708.1 hypothetical protein C4N15_08620 [Fusobacterium necrophorum subsp. funduliforme]AYV93193.1 hypothetical protein BSQ88_05760 [Fusobacterium necrophorum subsp. funduliforme]EYD69409.1 hypothetical protein FNF_05395 [Fusobacterium necrophorum subsp. funduliforme B35]KID49504.1 hypothetical protein C095_04970 [